MSAFQKLPIKKYPRSYTPRFAEQLEHDSDEKHDHSMADFMTEGGLQGIDRRIEKGEESWHNLRDSVGIKHMAPPPGRYHSLTYLKFLKLQDKKKREKLIK